jgi:hypothetical protein
MKYCNPTILMFLNSYLYKHLNISEFKTFFSIFRDFLRSRHVVVQSSSGRSRDFQIDETARHGRRPPARRDVTPGRKEEKFAD